MNLRWLWEKYLLKIEKQVTPDEQNKEKRVIQK